MKTFSEDNELVKATFKIGKTEQKLLKALSREYSTSMSAVIRRMIREECKRKNISIEDLNN